MFSKADDHVDWSDIVDHADVARRKGWEVAEVEFADSRHCNHFKKYTTRYHEMMRRLWSGESLANEPRSLL